MIKIREVNCLGVRVLVRVFEHEYEDEILLMRIREAERRANISGIKHEPGNRVMSDIPLDEDFSYQCCQSWR